MLYITSKRQTARAYVWSKGNIAWISINTRIFIEVYIKRCWKELAYRSMSRIFIFLLDINLELNLADFLRTYAQLS